MSRLSIFISCAIGNAIALAINGNVKWAIASTCGSAIALVLHKAFEPPK